MNDEPFIAKINLNKVLLVFVVVTLVSAGFFAYTFFSQPPKGTRVTENPIVKQEQELRDNYPLIMKLPYKTPYYKIYYTTEKNIATIVVETESPYYRFYALEKIRDIGYNPADYKIQFKNYVHPLGDV